MNKKLKLGLLATLLLVGCNVVTTPSSSSNTPSNGEFDYEDPKTGIVSETSHSSSSSSTSTRKDNYGDLDIEVIATVNDNGTFIAEAEDCDTKGCTLQAGCAGFFESTSFASGNMCIACISAPSILAFSFDLESSCDIEFVTVSAKYENPWNLDQNVSYYVDKDGNKVYDYTGTDDVAFADGKELRKLLAQSEQGKYIETECSEVALLIKKVQENNMSQKSEAKDTNKTELKSELLKKKQILSMVEAAINNQNEESKSYSYKA